MGKGTWVWAEWGGGLNDPPQQTGGYGYSSLQETFQDHLSATPLLSHQASAGGGPAATVLPVTPSLSFHTSTYLG